mmetsp:Transcript_27694/g.63785  ORF Transcript_27694/g.63785 Transcript_27694/m.63785 type:complete len:316 (-) Transcript_27694:113-1060(-)
MSKLQVQRQKEHALRSRRVANIQRREQDQKLQHYKDSIAADEAAKDEEARHREYLEGELKRLEELEKKRQLSLKLREEKFAREFPDLAVKTAERTKHLNELQWSRDQKIALLEERLRTRHSRLPPSSVAKRADVVQMDLRRAFRYVDQNKDGIVDVEDLFKSLSDLKYTVSSKKVVQAMLAQVAQEPTGSVKWKAYRLVFLEYITQRHEERPLLFHALIEFLMHCEFSFDEEQQLVVGSKGIVIPAEDVLEILARRFGEPSEEGLTLTFGSMPHWARVYTFPEFMHMLNLASTTAWRYDSALVVEQDPPNNDTLR